MPKRAGFWIRTLAALIDFFVLLIFFAAAVVVMSAVWDRYGRRAESVLAIAVYGLWLVYTTMEIWTAGTLGKLALGLRITALDGMPADFWRLSLRWSTKHLPTIATMLYAMTAVPGFYLLSGLSSAVVIVGCFFAANDDHLAWHDSWSHAAVYWKRSLNGLPPPLPATPPPTIQ